MCCRIRNSFEMKISNTIWCDNKVWLHIVNYNLENRMISSSVIPTISQTIRELNQPLLVKPDEVVAAITPTKSVAAVSTNVSVNMGTSSTRSIDTHA